MQKAPLRRLWKGSAELILTVGGVFGTCAPRHVLASAAGEIRQTLSGESISKGERVHPLQVLTAEPSIKLPRQVQ